MTITTSCNQVIQKISQPTSLNKSPDTMSKSELESEIASKQELLMNPRASRKEIAEAFKSLEVMIAAHPSQRAQVIEVLTRVVYETDLKTAEQATRSLKNLYVIFFEKSCHQEQFFDDLVTSMQQYDKNLRYFENCKRFPQNYFPAPIKEFVQFVESCKHYCSQVCIRFHQSRHDEVLTLLSDYSKNFLDNELAPIKVTKNQINPRTIDNDKIINIQHYKKDQQTICGDDRSQTIENSKLSKIRFSILADVAEHSEKLLSSLPVRTDIDEGLSFLEKTIRTCNSKELQKSIWFDLCEAATRGVPEVREKAGKILLTLFSSAENEDKKQLSSYIFKAMERNDGNIAFYKQHSCFPPKLYSGPSADYCHLIHCSFSCLEDSYMNVHDNKAKLINNLAEMYLAIQKPPVELIDLSGKKDLESSQKLTQLARIDSGDFDDDDSTVSLLSRSNENLQKPEKKPNWFKRWFKRGN